MGGAFLMFLPMVGVTSVPVLWVGLILLFNRPVHRAMRGVL